MLISYFCAITTQNEIMPPKLGQHPNEVMTQNGINEVMTQNLGHNHKNRSRPPRQHFLRHFLRQLFLGQLFYVFLGQLFFKSTFFRSISF